MSSPITLKVAAVFEAYPPKLRKKLLSLRTLIFKVAAETDAVGELEETLKWGQPSYAPTRPRTGSPIRIGPGKDNHYALFVHCQTSLAETFRELFPNTFTIEGNRALLFDVDAPLPKDELRECITLALTYHLKQHSN